MAAVKKIELEILLEGNTTPSKVVIECDSDLTASLTDCIKERFNVTNEYEFLPSLSEFAESPLGRPIDDAVQCVGYEAAKLHAEQPKLTWAQIAMRLCLRKREDTKHSCDKNCAHRIRKAAKPYLKHNK